MDLKQKLSYLQQIQHLKDKGISFHTFTEDAAIDYLQNHNNLFRLFAYRKNFSKSDKTNKYVNLDFGQLVDLSRMDTRIRMLILELSLSIEHFAKLKLLRMATENGNEDGYSIVSDYRQSLPPNAESRLLGEIARNNASVYIGQVYQKYRQNMPMWAFLELLSFGSFIHFYKFCAQRFGHKDMITDSYLLLTVKSIRNAAAHNNCLINDLITKSNPHRVQNKVTQTLSSLGISPVKRKSRMSCERIAQIVTCLILYSDMSKDIDSRKSVVQRLHSVSDTFFREFDYQKNLPISSSFHFLKEIIDKLFPLE